ncbi:ETC complex I subunit conserved region-domain-containing protein [Lobosporangium transversale]|uniref:NADH dehydrogenase [ubiquinone] iron-sulfur protein 4, mitochondrial n=1 Tax=Lobosporangium transversale TaxID=64571 RepID=A0A1Y2GU96_9FUNG|nr:ETC complex I subunit conserved region-domain-containing protein [Lobosporangium transversale]ORZ21846.1 ETC complex I subunit conserved region-domain-containing protein [Lobosporangium transversale]|eukprot:XP_021883097.1 ETC complex I subunit conserved region-domain-containing protein [Lobosporangium transversale]
MSASLLVKQAMRVPFAAAAVRPAASSSIKLYSTSTSTASNSTSVTEAVEPTTTLQAEIISGAPEEVRFHPCRIYQQAKAATQSGIANTGYWRLDFDTELEAERFENDSDYMHSLAMKFRTKEDAIAFADKQGWDYTVQEPNKRVFRKKVYADNFKYSPGKLRFVKTK